MARLRSPATAGVVDAVLVLLFAGIGWANHDAGHDERGPVLGTLVTAWPFLVGAALGWALVRSRSRQWPVGVGPGIVVWVVTVVLGMALRALSRQGTAPSFILVATLFLGVALVGWRALARRIGR